MSRCERVHGRTVNAELAETAENRSECSASYKEAYACGGPTTNDTKITKTHEEDQGHRDTKSMLPTRRTSAGKPADQHAAALAAECGGCGSGSRAVLTSLPQCLG